MELEKKREEFRSKYLGSEIKVGNETNFVNFSYLKKKFPQVLSNGCKYYRSDYRYKGKADFGFKDKPEFAYYEDQFKAYMGEENYKKLRPYLGM
ncbi:tRNA 2-selenouridine synthase, partial [Campylobacter insulaenigrae]|nr:tRNA 2-selenouridine synthase [Campylobacter insulaenigrae]